jgi:hypothetical protein
MIRRFDSNGWPLLGSGEPANYKRDGEGNESANQAGWNSQNRHVEQRFIPDRRLANSAIERRMQPSEKIRQDTSAWNGCGDDEAPKTPEEKTAILFLVGHLRDGLFHEPKSIMFAGERLIDIPNATIASLNDEPGRRP